MDVYGGLTSFSADCNWTVAVGSQKPVGEQRTISYEKPNVFNVQSKLGNTATFGCVSDGAKLIEYVNGPRKSAQSYTAPASIAEGRSAQLVYPMFCGTPLYEFLGGSAMLPNLVDITKAPISFGKEETVSGEPAVEVLFYAKGMYGHTDVLIGKNSGKVYSISYDSEPVMQMQQQRLGDSIKKLTENGKLVSTTTETYSNIAFNPALEAKEFAAVAPAGIQVKDVAAELQGDAPPPVKLGSPAPDFQVQPVSGGPKVDLKSLRGSVVLLDFWATWCAPCNAEMPETEKLYKELSDKGLKVMTISTEQAAVVKKYVGQKNWKIPAFVDPDTSASQAYNAGTIPTTAIIDKDGKLQAYFVGYGPGAESMVRASLKKIGIG